MPREQAPVEERDAHGVEQDHRNGVQAHCRIAEAGGGGDPTQSAKSRTSRTRVIGEKSSTWRCGGGSGLKDCGGVGSDPPGLTGFRRSLSINQLGGSALLPPLARTGSMGGGVRTAGRAGMAGIVRTVLACTSCTPCSSLYSLFLPGTSCILCTPLDSLFLPLAWK